MKTSKYRLETLDYDQRWLFSDPFPNNKHQVIKCTCYATQYVILKLNKLILQHVFAYRYI